MPFGVVQGLIIEHKISNVIMTNVLFKSITNPTKPAFLDKLNTTTLTDDITNSEMFPKNVVRSIITYVCHVAIVTTNSNEINDILAAVFASFLEFDLNASNIQFQVIRYSSDKSFKFKYLGFCFVYVPVKYIKKGGILSRHDDITEIKFSKVRNGSFLIYTCPKTFCELKKKCKSLIKLLLQVSFAEVLNQVNLVV